MHHRLQCQGNEPCFPVFYVQVIAELREGSLFSGRSDTAWFCALNACCITNYQGLAFQSNHEKYGSIVW